MPEEITGNKSDVFPLIFALTQTQSCEFNETYRGNKKAAPLGAAVIATLNHITGLTLHDSILAGMG